MSALATVIYTTPEDMKGTRFEYKPLDLSTLFQSQSSFIGTEECQRKTKSITKYTSKKYDV